MKAFFCYYSGALSSSAVASAGPPHSSPAASAAMYIMQEVGGRTLAHEYPLPPPIVQFALLLGGRCWCCDFPRLSHRRHHHGHLVDPSAVLSGSGGGDGVFGRRTVLARAPESKRSMCKTPTTDETRIEGQRRWRRPSRTTHPIQDRNGSVCVRRGGVYMEPGSSGPRT